MYIHINRYTVEDMLIVSFYEQNMTKFAVLKLSSLQSQMEGGNYLGRSENLFFIIILLYYSVIQNHILVDFL